MRQVYGFVGLLILIASPVFPQAMLEYATAAAAGSAAGAASKGVSEGLDKVLRQVENHVEEMSKPQLTDTAKPVKPTTAQFPRAEDNPISAPQPSRTGTSQETVSSAIPATPAPISITPAPNVRSWTQETLVPFRPEPTLDDLTGVETGTSRTELAARLGDPSARVVIPEEGQLREIFHYTGRGVHLGLVRLVDGAVSSVEVDPMAK